MTGYNLTFVRRFPGHCHQEVTRGGELQACDKPAVAVKAYLDSTFPVCKHHTNGDLVPLADLLKEGAS